MTLVEQIEAAKARLAAANAAITSADDEEIKTREELAKTLAEADERETEKARLDAERRKDLLEDVKPGTYAIVMAKGFSDTFILRRNGKAHSNWVKRISPAASGGKAIDTEAAARDYAVAVVVDWNGLQDFDSNADSTSKLQKYLRDNPGVVSPITDAAAELAGVYAREFKS